MMSLAQLAQGMVVVYKVVKSVDIPALAAKAMVLTSAWTAMIQPVISKLGLGSVVWIQ